MSEVTLREYIERLLSEHEKSHDLARENLDARLAQLNELREAVQTDRGLFLTREFYDAQYAELREKVDKIVNEQAVRAELIPQLRRALADIEELKSSTATASAVGDALASYRRWLAGTTITLIIAIIGAVIAFVTRH